MFIGAQQRFLLDYRGISVAGIWYEEKETMTFSLVFC